MRDKSFWGTEFPNFHLDGAKGVCGSNVRRVERDRGNGRSECKIPVEYARVLDTGTT